MCNEMEKDEPLGIGEILQGLGRGTPMYKVKSVQNFYRRHFFVDLPTMRLRYRPSSKRLLCSTGQSFLDLHDIDEVRCGWKSDVFYQAKSRYKRQMRLQALNFSKLEEDCCFSLVLGLGETLNLVAPNSPTRDAWVQGLKHLVASCKDRARQDELNCWLREQFRNADRNNNGSLSFVECLQLLNTLNVKMDLRQAKTIFDSANFRKSPGLHNEALDPDEFVLFYRALESRPELESLFKKYSINDAMIWGPQELMKFLQEEQKCPLPLNECVSLIDVHFDETADGAALKGYMTLRGFRSLLLSVDHDLFQCSRRVVCVDMSRPLNHYYIACSHNTYLIQGQMVGESSIEGYVRALKSGCRCLEIDMWDGPSGEPVVFHGHTLTSKIFLRDVIQTIKQYAFVNSQFPVILSLENHLSVEQQRVAADIFANILGDYLYSAPVGKHETEYPSPEKLARKILIKGKKMSVGTSEEETEQEMLEEEQEKDPKIQPQESKAVPRLHLLSRQLSDLVNYCKATRFHSFEEANDTWAFYEMASFSEGTANSMILYNSQDLLNYNKHHLSRIYPGALRVDSSNMEPVPYWNLGCQLVALNYQSNDVAILLNKAMFMDNGGCGYIPIMPYIMDGLYDPSKPPDDKFQKTFHLKIISGQSLPKPNQAREGEVVDPYIKIRVYGHPSDCQVQKTSIIHNNGFNPVWNEELSFPVLLPDLAIMTFQVKDNCNTGTNRRLAVYALPCSAIAPGYRHLHLWNDAYEELVPATLFLHVTIK